MTRRRAQRAAVAAALAVGALLPLVVAAASKPVAPPPPATIGDLKPRGIELRRDQKIASSVNRAMDNYRRYLELQNADPKLKAEALRRLGDLNLESGEIERMEKEVNSIDLAGAEAIRLYGTLLKAYPDYPRNGEVLYQLARAYETTGQSEKALATLEEIVLHHPQTSQLDEVQFRRGEILFSNKRYADAEKAYAKALDVGKGRAFYSQSLYKHGWSLFKQGLNEESLPSFAQVLEQVLLDPRDGSRVIAPEQMSRPVRELVDDTLRVMAITFSYLDGAKSLDAFVAKRGTPAYSYLLYTRLGDLYVEKQRYQDAADTYRAFVARDPNDEHAPLLAMQAIEAYRKGGFAQLVLDGKRDYIERYNFASDFWKGRDRAANPQLVAELKTNMKDVATWYHATAQKSKKPEDYLAAARWYRDYLASFPDDPDSAATDYLLADTLFEARSFGEAALEYDRVAYDFPRGERSAAAAYAGLDARQKERAAAPPAGQEALNRAQIDAGIRFAQAFPEHPDSGGVLTRAAQELSTLKDLPRAIEVSRLVLAHQPPVDAAKQRIAWTIIGQANFDNGVFDQAEEAYAKARDLAPANDPLRKDLSERLAASVYKQGEAKREQGDDSGAVDAFLRVAALSPDPTVRATAEFDAAAQLLKAKQWARAIPVLEGYRKNYPQDARQADVTRNLAVAYSEAGRPADAAAEFERIAASPAEDREVKREALQSAADLYAKAGDEARAVPVLERFIAQFPTPPGPAVEARQRLADFAAKGGNRSREEYWQREIIKVDAGAGAERTDRMRYLAAKAQLALAAPARDAYRGIKLVAPLKKSLAAKRKALEVAMQAYKSAVDYRVTDVTTAATYEMAELYRTLGKDVMASERPKKLSRDEREQYDTLLEEQAFPFEEQAIELHVANAARVKDGVYDAWVRKSYAELAAVKPARYGKTEIDADLALGDAGVQPAQRAAALDAQAKRKAGDAPAAETALRAAVESARGAAGLWTELGLAQRQQGKLDDAMVSYTRALEAKPDYAPATRDMAVLLDVYMDDPVRALEYFERYKAMTPDDKQFNGWVAEVRQRAAKAIPAAPTVDAAPAVDAAPDAAPPRP